VRGSGLDAPALDFTQRPALMTAAERVPPLLVLFRRAAGTQLGPPLAARLGGAFAPAADLEVSESPLPLTTAWGASICAAGGATCRPTAASIPSSSSGPSSPSWARAGRPRDGARPTVEVQTIACGPPPRALELESRPNEHAGVPLARTLVLVGAGADATVAAELAAAVAEHAADVAVVDLARVRGPRSSAARPACCSPSRRARRRLAVARAPASGSSARRARRVGEGRRRVARRRRARRRRARALGRASCAPCPTWPPLGKAAP